MKKKKKKNFLAAFSNLSMHHEKHVFVQVRMIHMPGTLTGKLVVDRRLPPFLQFLLQESLEEPRSLTTF